MSSHERARIRLERLRQVRERHPGSLSGARAGLLTGVLLADREPAEALSFLRAAHRDFPILDDYIRFWMGEAYLKVGDLGLAAILYDSIPEVEPESLLLTRSLLRSGTVRFRVGQCKLAIDFLIKASADEPQSPEAPAALLSAAECLISELRPEEAGATLRRVWTRYPNTKEAREAQVQLSRLAPSGVWNPSPDDRLARALTLHAMALHAEAAEELTTFLSSSPTHPRRDDAKFKLGVSFARLKLYDKSAPVFVELAKHDSTEAHDATAWLARIYLRQGDGDRLQALGQSLPKLALPAEQQFAVLMAIGVWHEDQGHFQEAMGAYRRAAQAAENLSDQLDAWWRVGWTQYRGGQWREAAQTFREVALRKEDPQFTPKFLYWSARSLERVQDGKAKDVYGELCRTFPLTYYCQMAQLRSMTQSPTLLASGPGAGNGEGRSSLLKERHYRKAAELQLLGLQREAGEEFAKLSSRYAKNRDVLLELTALLGESGAHHQALRLARLHFRDGIERGIDPVPPALWKVAYPTAYLPTIRGYANGRVDPFLVAAIIREESLYDARAVSRVGALGLMQLMLPTAQAVAKRSGGTEPVREELFDQDTNIRYGTRYLAQLVEQFSGNLIRAIAAYNAGPVAVQNWVTLHGDKDPDEFVELIPYQETRHYVKRVLRSYREYQRLAEQTCATQFLDKAC